MMKKSQQLVQDHIYANASTLVETISKHSTALGLEDEELDALFLTYGYEEAILQYLKDHDFDEIVDLLKMEIDFKVFLRKFVTEPETIAQLEGWVKEYPQRWGHFVKLAHKALMQSCSAREFCENYEIPLDGYEIEALEHWVVSYRLLHELRDRGEMTGELFGIPIWGRTTSGQAIALDGVIRAIASELYN